MTAKEYLRRASHQIYALRLLVINGEMKEQQYRNRLLSTAKTFDDMPRGGKKPDMADAIAVLADQAVINAKNRNRLTVAEGELTRIIRSVQDDEMILVLDLHYVKMLSWETVAQKMNMSRSTVLRRHGAALQRINITT